MSNSLKPHRLPRTRLPHLLLSLRVCSESCPLSRWCYLTISSSAAHLFCLQSFPASGSFPMSQFFASGGPSIGASASVLPIMVMSFRIDWFDLPAIQGTVEGPLQHHNSKASVLRRWAFFMVQLSHPYMTTRKIIALLDGPLSAKWCLCFLIHSLGLS